VGRLAFLWFNGNATMQQPVNGVAESSGDNRLT
jgi:hypothetical protein